MDSGSPTRIGLGGAIWKVCAAADEIHANNSNGTSFTRNLRHRTFSFDAGKFRGVAYTVRPPDHDWWTEHEELRPGCRARRSALALSTYCDSRRRRAQTGGRTGQTGQERGKADPRAEGLDLETPDQDRRQGCRL